MLKKALVKPVGDDGFSTWQLLCDEGGMYYEQSSPNPLSYLTTGIDSSLLTQVQHSAKIMNLELENIKIEAKVLFRFNDLMSNTWAGYTDKVIANILIQSKESPGKISQLKQVALKAWSVGEGLANKTDIETELVVNAEHWDGIASSGGSVPNPISVDNNMTITSKTSVPKPTTFEVGEDVGITPRILFSNKIEFAVVAIAQSARDTQRPYLQKIKVRAIQDNYAAWTLYADDSYGYEGLDKAPTSLDYVTAGTALCLMSQLDINQEFFRFINRRFEKFDIDDYRVEQQINYRQEEIASLKTTGFVDKVITKIVVNSKASKEDLKTFFNTSLQMCFAGEAFKNETEIVSNIYLNGNIIK
ncbi:hypothetical protein GJV85_07230 [Sulfurimonas aquatica]|uniref:Uncharacterized protein n=1 Tax=Sulfurimonas aquatica TaxID=2672570 RepID=A0A975B0J0_9BACT|nr:hypothetical protein [Sulfurimonas aquatica]QSZ41905.1 hypothetical protein GJV85_07230 [Sulfurimonas aquatica]